MKKGALLNSVVSAVIAQLGHTDTVTIGDAGLPIPQGPLRIDLALTQGIPSFMQVLETVSEEMQVEHAVLAEEVKQHNAALHQAMLAQLEKLQQRQGNIIAIEYIPHDAFKQRTRQSQAVIRSGECSPYANVILGAGVTF